MKVTHVYKTYMPDTQGGMEECIRQLCLQTKQLGVENTVLSVSKHVKAKEEMDRPECKLIRFPSTADVASTALSWQMLMQYKGVVQGADLIHYHFPWPTADLMHFLRQIKKPYLVTYQSDIVKQKFLKKLYSPLMNRFLKGAKYITVASPNYLESSTVLQAFKNKCHVVPLGLDYEGYPMVSNKELETWEEKVKGKDFFLFVGVFRYYKGLHFLLEALEGTSFQLVLAGAGPFEKELKKEVIARGLSSQVLFTGFLEEKDKVALLKLCKAFVFPSHLRSEAFGISLLEAAMFGKPLISCEIGSGTTFINQDKRTGLIVEPEDSEGLRSALHFFMDDANKLEIESMGETARKRFENIFTAKQMGETCFKLYEDIIQKEVKQ